MKYEYLIASLPELRQGGEAPMTMDALESLLSETLCERDLEQLRLLKLHAQEGACAFVLDWLHFNKDLNNILTEEICRKHNLDPKMKVVGQMPDEITPEIKALSKMDNLYEREKQIDAVRFAWLEERTQTTTFDLENVLAYYLMNEMLNRWMVLNVEKGEQVFRELVSDMKKGIKI